MGKAGAYGGFLGLFLVLTCSGLQAQLNRGSIRGTVRDPQGAVVPRAQIVITNTDTGVSQPTITDGAGFYFVPALVPGSYRVHLAMAGFIPVDVTKIQIRPNDTTTVDIQLELGRSAQSVEVTATAGLVDTSASNFNVPVAQQYLQQLPLLGRDIQSLVQLIPGVTQSNGPPGTLVAFNGGQFGGFPDPTHILGSQLSVNGSQASANVWYLDGNLNSAEGVDNAVVNPPPDAVSEFQAVTDGFAAEYGRTAGAVFNVVLKSGSNEVHGDLYDYNRNSYFSARNPFAGYDPFGKELPPNYVNWNQFGGTVGGPVELPHIYDGKDHTFFFVALDVSKLIEKSPGTLFTVPTLLERQGNFSEFPSAAQYGIYDPSTTKYSSALGTFTRQPFLSSNGSLATTIPADRIDPVAQWFMNQFPAPNFLDPRQQNAAAGGCLNTCNNYQAGYGSSETTKSADIKVDHQIGDKNKLFVEWLYNPTDYTLARLPWTGATVPLLGFGGSFPFHTGNQIAALGLTTSFSATLINEFRFSVSRQNVRALPVPNALQDTTGTLQRLRGLNIPLFPPLDPVPGITVGSTYFGPPGLNFIQTTNGFTLLDGITKVVSKHTVKIGFMYRDDQVGSITPGTTSLYFGGTLTDNPVTGQGGSPFAQFLLGAVDQGSSVSSNPSAFSSTHTWSFYTQDDWRVTPTLTLNLGLRYDIYGWFHERHCNASLFDFSDPNPEDPVRRGRIEYTGTSAHPSCTIFPPNQGDLAPRVGFSWSPFADQKTVVRGGFDLIYTNGNTMENGALAGWGDIGYGAYHVWNTDATGQGFRGTGAVPAFLLSQGAPTLPPLPNLKLADSQFLGPQSVGTTPLKNERDPNVMLWNLQIQRELPGNLAVSAAYVGSKGTDLIGGNTQYNWVPTSVRLRLRSQLNQLVPMPSDLAPFFGADYYESQLYMHFPQYTAISCGGGCGMGGSTSYNGLEVKVEKRFSHGLNFLASYTAEKTIATAGIGGYFSNTWTGGSNEVNARGRVYQLGTLSNNGGGQNPDNWNGDRSLAPDDVPQIFNTAWTYELPFGPGKPFATHARGVPRLLVQGWKITGNFNTQSGIPLNISGPCNPLEAATAPFPGCRPNLIGDPNAGRSGKSRYQQEQQWFNPNAFQAVFGSDPAIIALATNGTPQQLDAHDEFWRYGTAGYRLGNARSPGFWNMDMALSKDFPLNESKLLQFRLEMYNAFNHQNLGLPNTHWCLPPNPDGSTDAVHQFGCQFGLINAVQTDPRALEFALKFVF